MEERQNATSSTSLLTKRNERHSTHSSHLKGAKVEIVKCKPNDDLMSSSSKQKILATAINPDFEKYKQKRYPPETSKVIQTSINPTRRHTMRRFSRRESTVASGRPKVGIVDFERLKAEVYRDWVGRRDAFDFNSLKAKYKDSKKNKEQPLKQENLTDGASNKLASSQVKGVMRSTKGLSAALGKVEDVQRKKDATNPLVRKSSATGSKPLRTPSNTVLRVGSHRDTESVNLSEIDQEDALKLTAVRQQARKRRSTYKVKIDDPCSKHSTDTASSDVLTSDQIKAFREVFNLFDSDGGGTIDSEELELTLKTVNIHLSKDEITEMLKTIDKDGSGEIDFAEFLQLMTNTERFLATLNAERRDAAGRHLERRQGGGEVLLFDALTEFMKKSAIENMDEIVGYYSTKYKKSKVPHVVTHYAAGARLIGLTEKQLQEHMDNINQQNIESGQQTSPYAQPLPFAYSTNKLRGKRQRNKCRLKIRLDADSTGTVSLGIASPPSRRPKTSLADHTETLGRGWLSQRIPHAEVALPSHELNQCKPYDQLNHEDLPLIREKVAIATEMYHFKQRQKQVRCSLQHWKGLEAHLISPSVLRNHFRRIFSTYTGIDTCYLPLPM